MFECQLSLFDFPFCTGSPEPTATSAANLELAKAAEGKSRVQSEYICQSFVSFSTSSTARVLKKCWHAAFLSVELRLQVALNKRPIPRSKKSEFGHWFGIQFQAVQVWLGTFFIAFSVVVSAECSPSFIFCMSICDVLVELLKWHSLHYSIPSLEIAG